jgi:protein-disulfide isomerase
MKQGKAFFLMVLFTTLLASNKGYTVVPDITIGQSNAPITIIEYSSLTCHYCAEFHKEVLPALKKKYLDTGKARLVFRNFSSDAYGIAAACLLAKAPAIKRVGLLNELFLKQAQWMSPEYVRELAAIFSLPVSQAQTITSDKALIKALGEDFLAAQTKYNINATPYFIVNGRVIDYKPKLEELEKLMYPKAAPGTEKKPVPEKPLSQKE